MSILGIYEANKLDMEQQYIIRTCTTPEMYLKYYCYTANKSQLWIVDFTSNIEEAMIFTKDPSIDIILSYVQEKYPNSEYVRVISMS